MATGTKPRRTPARPPRAKGEDAKEARRSLILAAAKEVFARAGYHDTTIGHVAKAAGISYGSVYWYFDSKEALFVALMDHQEASLRAHIAATVDDLDPETAADVVAVFRQSVRATFEFFEGDRDLVKLLFRDSLVLGNQFDKHLVGLYEGFIGDIEVAIRAGQDLGEVIDAPSRLIAFSVASLIGQVALRRLTTDDGLSAERAADFVVTVVLDGVRPRKEQP